MSTIPHITSSTRETGDFTDPHPISSLRYRLYCVPVDVSPLVVRQVRCFRWGGAQVTVYVLGASHAVTILLPFGVSVTELLTCLPPREERMKGNEEKEEWQVPRLPGGVWNKKFQTDTLHGHVRVQHLPLTPSADSFLESFSPGDVLHEPFPLPTGETAWTRVGWREAGPVLHIETIHTYPEAKAAIHSATAFCVSAIP